MNWTKILGGGVVAGVVVSLVNYLLHGVIMSDTYERYSSVFSQEQANPIWFFVVAIAIAIFFTILFAKTRDCWAEGAKGGITYGFWLGMVAFFGNFYDPLVIDGFPYYLAWCHGGISLIGFLVGGAIVGLIIKR
jgi:phosphotransferase system  glucose/maltose/N-acetylglucosamine-specific IIC component